MNGHKSPAKQFMLVIWDDAHADSTSELSEDEITHEPSSFYSYGWMLKSDAKGISLAAEWNPNNNKWRGHMFIDRKMVVEVLEITLTKKRVKKVKAAATEEAAAAISA